MRRDEIRPKTLHCATPLLHRDRVDAVVVVADNNPAAELAGGTVAEFVAQTLGLKLPVLAESDYEVTKRYKRRHILAFGSLGDHRLLTRLYEAGEHYADARFPGAEGFVLRTIHDLDGTGRNVVALTGGDPDGWDLGTEALCDLFAAMRDRTVLPSTNCVVSQVAPPEIDRDEARALLERLAQWARADERELPATALLEWAHAFDVGGCVTRGMLFRTAIEMLEGWMERRSRPSGDWLPRPELWLGDLVSLWDNLEERTGFDAGFRSLVTHVLLDAARNLHSRWGSLYRWHSLEDFPGPDWAGALWGLQAAGRYFLRGHKLPEAREWLVTVRSGLDEGRTVEPLASGSAWDQCRTLRDLLRVAVQSPGEVRRTSAIGLAAQHWIAAFWAPGGWPVGFGGRVADVADLAAVAGRALWLASREDRPTPAECLAALESRFVPGGFHLPPVQYESGGETAIAPLLLGRAPVAAGTIVDPAAHPALRDLLHAGVGLRAMVRTRGEFILLGGCRLSDGSHEDTQAAIRLEYYSRPFIADLPVLGPGRDRHAGTSIAVDGAPVAPHLSALVGRLHAGRVRAAALTSVDAGLPRWRRVVFHVPGMGFLIVDRVESLSAGRVVARRFFPLIGRPDGDGAVTLSQGDAVMDVIPGEQVSASLRGERTDLSALSNLVEDAEDQVHHLEWTVEQPATPEHPLTLASEIVLRSHNEQYRLVRERRADGLWLCNLPNTREVLLGLDWEAMDKGRTEADCEAFVVGAFVGFAGLRRLVCDMDYIETSAPCEVLIDPTGRQEARIASTVETEVFVRHAGELVTAVLDAGAVWNTVFSIRPEHMALWTENVRVFGSGREVDTFEVRHGRRDARDGSTHH